MHRSIGQDQLALSRDERPASTLDELSALIDWNEITGLLKTVHGAAKGEAAWPPIAMFRADLRFISYDLSDVKIAEALDERSSFRTFCRFSKTEVTPEGNAFVRFCKALIAQGIDYLLFERVTLQLKARAATVTTGTIVNATIIASTSEDDGDARWVKQQNKKAVHGCKAHVGVDADTVLIEEFALRPANVDDGKAGPAPRWVVSPLVV
jgi:transposase, IS5 family